MTSLYLPFLASYWDSDAISALLRKGYLNGGHEPFCDSIMMYVIIAIPIIVKIPGTIFAQICGICCPQPKSTKISASAIIPTTAAIRHITIDFIFLEFAISFSLLTSFVFKFD